MKDAKDDKYMEMALELAEKGRGTAAPNPMVGAVIVKDGKVIGKGWHKKPGTPHGEAMALSKAGGMAEGATLYVNLEPCCHRDKLTPPCTDAVIKSKVKRVVVGMPDPNPKVSGRGIKLLRKAGITVDVGVLAERCERLNEPFSKHISTGLPKVTMKIAQTLDGKIATSTGESKWITGPEARRHSHMLRNQVDAIVVGIGTVLRDDPSLTTRIEGMDKTRDPHRVILDSTLRIPLDAKVLNLDSKAKTYVATTIAASTQKMKEIKKKKAELLIIDAEDEKVSLPLLMEELGKLGMTNVLIEGGARVNAAALRTPGLVDRVQFFVAPKILGGDDARGSVGGKSPEHLSDAVELAGIRHSMVGGDILIEAFVKRPEPASMPKKEPRSEPEKEQAVQTKPRPRKKTGPAKPKSHGKPEPQGMPGQMPKEQTTAEAGAKAEAQAAPKRKRRRRKRPAGTKPETTGE